MVPIGPNGSHCTNDLPWPPPWLSQAKLLIRARRMLWEYLRPRPGAGGNQPVDDWLIVTTVDTKHLTVTIINILVIL